MSVGGAKAWLTYNPEGPAHWFKRNVVDRAEHYDARLVRFALDDNPTLEDSVKDRYRASYTGHWRQRLVEGEWAGASGLIFPRWTECDEPHESPTEWRCGLDWGVSSVLHLLVASVRNREARVMTELRHDATAAGVWTEAEAVAAIAAHIHSATGGVRRPVLYVDPSTPQSVKRLLRLKGIRVIDAFNDVLPGLSMTADALAAGRLTINPKGCPALVEELQTYAWDDAKTELGQDAPLKQHDHGCDALRYVWASVGHSAAYKPTSVAMAMRN